MPVSQVLDYLPQLIRAGASQTRAARVLRNLTGPEGQQLFSFGNIPFREAYRNEQARQAMSPIFSAMPRSARPNGVYSITPRRPYSQPYTYQFRLIGQAPQSGELVIQYVNVQSQSAITRGQAEDLLTSRLADDTEEFDYQVDWLDTTFTGVFTTRAA